MYSQNNLYRLTLTIHGRVQGVFFRETACVEAKRLGLVGTVANNPDGTVKVIAEGTKETLEEFKKWCERGPERAQVEKIAEQWQAIPQLIFAEFSCVYH